jgi:hypothetical protein
LNLVFALSGSGHGCGPADLIWSECDDMQRGSKPYISAISRNFFYLSTVVFMSTRALEYMIHVIQYDDLSFAGLLLAK